MTDSTPIPASDPKRATPSDLAIESFQAANSAVKYAHDAKRLAMNAWTTAIEMGDPRTIEVAKIALDQAERGVTDALRIVAIAQTAADVCGRAVEAQTVQ